MSKITLRHSQRKWKSPVLIARIEINDVQFLINAHVLIPGISLAHANLSIA